jgi:hypothetical protein
MRMLDIRERFRTYSERFPEDVINLEDEVQKIKTKVESAFTNDIVWLFLYYIIRKLSFIIYSLRIILI